MTPIKLLTKSNSIRGMTDRGPAYRMTKLALPKFVSPPRATGLRVEMEPVQKPVLVPVRIAAAKPIIEEPVALKKVEIEEVQVLDTAPAVTVARPEPRPIQDGSPYQGVQEGSAGASPFQGPSLSKRSKNWLPKINLPKLSLPKFNLPKIDFGALLARIKFPKQAPKVVRFVREEEPNQTPVSLPNSPEPEAEVMPFAVIEPSAPIAPRLPARMEPPAPIVAPVESAARPKSEASVAPVLVKQKSQSSTWDLLLRRITFRRRAVRVAGVQTELALERVSPVRNDLSEADLEVIPRMGTKKRETNPFGNGSKGGRARKAKEETNAAPPMVPVGAMAEKPTE